MSFDEFHLFDEFHITRFRTKVSGIVAHSTTRYAAWATLLGPFEKVLEVITPQLVE